MARKPDLTLAMDFGGSATKVLISPTEWNPSVLWMEPEVAVVDKLLIDAYERERLGQSEERNRAWVGYGDCYYAVGYLAQYKFSATPGLSELKYERAIPKALAAIWVAVERLGFRKKLSVAIACVLPPGEYVDADQIESQLRDALKCFDTPSGKLQARLTNFTCKPEGGATYMMVFRNQQKALLNRVLAVIMVGYRNASILISNRGEIGSFKTSDLGFAQMISAVIQRTSGQTPNLLVPAIFNAGVNVEAKHLHRLLRSTDEGCRSAELQNIQDAIALSRKGYFLKIESWLKENLPRELDEVILCGGTVDYLAPEFKLLFQLTPIQWHGNIVIPDELNQGLGSRLVDVYSLLVYFRQSILKLSNAPLANVTHEAS